MPRKKHSVRSVFRHWLALQLGCVLALMACGDTGPANDLLIFEGTITNAASGAAISGAGVGFGDGSGLAPAILVETTTDAQGRYSLSHHGCTPNPYIIAIATGFNGNDKPVGCRAGTTATVDIALTPAP